MSTLGPCFTTAKTDSAVCKHEIHQQFSWLARDDTAPGGEVLVLVCMGCDTIIRIGTVKKVKKQ